MSINDIPIDELLIRIPAWVAGHYHPPSVDEDEFTTLLGRLHDHIENITLTLDDDPDVDLSVPDFDDLLGKYHRHVLGVMDGDDLLDDDPPRNVELSRADRELIRGLAR